jgi:hypothetical protein
MVYKGAANDFSLSYLTFSPQVPQTVFVPFGDREYPDVTRLAFPATHAQSGWCPSLDSTVLAGVGVSVLGVAACVATFYIHRGARAAQAVQQQVVGVQDVVERIAQEAAKVVCDIFMVDSLRSVFTTQNMLRLSFVAYDFGKAESTADYLVSAARMLVEVPGLVVNFSGIRSLLEVFARDRGAVAQAGEERFGMMHWFSSALVVSAMQKAKKSLDPAAAWRLTSRLAKVLRDGYAMGKVSWTLTSVYRVFPFIEKLVQKVVDMLMPYFCTAHQPLHGVSDQIITWAEDVIALNNEDSRDLIATDPDSQMRVFQLHRLGQRYQVEVLRGTPSKEVSQNFRIIMQVCQNLSEIASRGRDNRGFRVEPFCFSLYGEPGIGKSFLASSLLQQCGALEGFSDPSDVYARSAEDDYWSAYAHQYGVLYDDFPKTDTDITRGVGMGEFLNMKSPVPFSLNMAAVQDKGKNFSSKIVAVTTNKPFFVPNSMLDKQAYFRRRDILVKVESSIGRVTQENAETIQPGYPHLSFTLMDPCDPKERPLSRALPYRDFVNLLVNKYDGWLDKEYARMAAMNVQVKDMRTCKNQTKEVRFMLMRGAKAVAQAGPEPSTSLGHLAVSEEHLSEEELLRLIAELEVDPLAEPLEMRLRNFVRWVRARGHSALEQARLGLERHPVARLRRALSALPSVGELLSSLPNYVMLAVVAAVLLPILAVVMKKTQQRNAQPADAGNPDAYLLWRLQHRRMYTPQQSALETSRIRRALRIIDGLSNVDIDEDEKIARAVRGSQAEAQGAGMDPVEEAVKWAAAEIANPRSDSDLPLRLLQYIKACATRPGMEHFVVGANASTYHENVWQLLHDWATETPGFDTASQAIMVEFSEEMAKRISPQSGDKRLARRGRTKDEKARQDREWDRWLVNNNATWRDIQGYNDDNSGGIFGQANTVFDKPLEDMTAIMLTRNWYKVARPSGAGFITVQALAVVDRLILLPWHVFEGATFTTSFVIEDAMGRRWEGPISSTDVYRISNRDIAMMTLPVKFSICRNILSYFATEDALDRISEHNVLLTSRRSGYLEPMNARATRMGEEQEDVVHYSVGGPIGRQYQLERGWKYDMPTKIGDCGALLCLVKPMGTTGRICGIHVAGNDSNGGTGWAEYISQDKLRKLVDHILDTPPLEVIAQCDVIPGTPRIGVPNGDFMVFGKTAGPIVYAPNKTTLRPSPIYGDLKEPTTGPSVLSSSDPRTEATGSILLKAIEKYKGVPGGGLLGNRSRALEDYFTDKFSKSTRMRRLWTNMEAVYGVVGDPIAKGLDPKASMGIPYIFNNLRRKDQLEGWSENGNGSVLWQRFTAREEMARRGVVAETWWVDALKDERRSLAKILTGKTRSFCFPPLDHTILLRKYCGAFLTMLMSGDPIWSSTVGINPHGPQWHALATELEGFSVEHLEGDYQGFDGNIDSPYAQLFLGVMNRWYDDGTENKVVRRVLVESCMHRFAQAIDLLYQVFAGNPSGGGLTTHFNCFVNATYLRESWLAIQSIPTTKVAELRTLLRTFDDLFKDKNYGDDLLVATKASRSIFKQMVDFLQTIGVVLTDADKSGGEFKIRKLEELTFLKHKFAWIPALRQYRGKFSLEDIHEMLNWVRKGDQFQRLRENCYQAQLFLFFHGESVYNVETQRIKAAFDNAAFRAFNRPNPLVIRPYNEWLDEALKMDPEWGMGPEFGIMDM